MTDLSMDFIRSLAKNLPISDPIAAPEDVALICFTSGIVKSILLKDADHTHLLKFLSLVPMRSSNLVCVNLTLTFKYVSICLLHFNMHQFSL